MKGSAEIPDQVGVNNCPDPLAHFFRGPHFERKIGRLLKAFYWVRSANSLLLSHSRRRRFDTAAIERRLLTRLGVSFNGVIYRSPKLTKLRRDRGVNLSVLVGQDPCCPRSLVVFVENSNRAYRAFAVKR